MKEDLIKMFLSGLSVFVFKYLYDYFTGKSVKLTYAFSASNMLIFEPHYYTSHLHISNFGKAVANNIIIRFNRELYTGAEVDLSIAGDEKYIQDNDQQSVIIQFERLRPNESVDLWFKSKKPLDEKFISVVKSDELVGSRSDDSVFLNVLTFLSIGLCFVGVFCGGIAYQRIRDNTSRPNGNTVKQEIVQKQSQVQALASNLSIVIKTNKQIYKPNDEIKIKVYITNLSTTTITDLDGYLRIPGLRLSYEQRNHCFDYLAAKEPVQFQVSTRIPNEFPIGNYNAKALFSGYKDEERIIEEAGTVFVVE